MNKIDPGQIIDPGPLMVDVEGVELTGEDRELIAHPRVGGIVLFTRNYDNKPQLQRLVAQIRAARSGELLIAVDHEGGRVQRFRDGFTAIPPMRQFGNLYETEAGQACSLLTDTCHLVASELASCDIDFSFSPCVDIDHEVSSVIGDRALHSSVTGVVELARAALAGYREGGMVGVIKHFPGHGGVQNDTHLGFATDPREYEQIAGSEMQPFAQLVGDAAAVMPAHVIYSKVDEMPASLSVFWQQEVLRRRLGYSGAIVSDDLSMGAATGIAHQSETALLAINAGTDVALICNDRQAAVRACENVEIRVGDPVQVARRLTLRRREPARKLGAGKQKQIQSRLQLLSSQSER